VEGYASQWVDEKYCTAMPATGKFQQWAATVPYTEILFILDPSQLQRYFDVHEIIMLLQQKDL
jgi:hypothetical protein